MSSDQVNPSAGRPLSAGAIALMLMLCLSWGFNQIAVKLALPDVPPMLQALIRSVGALAGAADHRLVARRQILRARRHAVAGPCCRHHLRHRIRADLSRPAADLGIARGGVSLHRAVLRGARLLSVSRRAAARVAMGRTGLELCRRRTRDRRAAGQCRCRCPARRSPDRRRRRAVGGDHATGQGHRAAQGAGGKGPRLPGGDVDPDPRLSRRGFRANESPMSPGRCRCRCWPIRRSGWSD